jgi:hypothetical protein
LGNFLPVRDGIFANGSAFKSMKTMLIVANDDLEVQLLTPRAMTLLGEHLGQQPPNVHSTLANLS